MNFQNFNLGRFISSFPLWTLIGLLLSVYCLALFQGYLRVNAKEHLIVIAATLSAVSGSAFYTFKRPDERLARLFLAVAEVVLLTFLSGSLSYAAATLNNPLWDAVFDAWDKSLGFQWRTWLSILNEHPQVHLVLATAYHSMVPQIGVVIVALVTVRAYRALDTFLIAFGSSAGVTVMISALMPAISPLPYYGILPSDYPNITLAVPSGFAEQVLALRDGSLRMFELTGAAGLVTFPSFHTISGVLLALAFWHVPVLRWWGVALNGLMLLSVPLEGSHYLVDLIAGIMIALIAWYLALAFTVEKRVAKQLQTSGPSVMA